MSPRLISSLRSYGVAIATVGVVTGVKSVFGDALGREAPFALFGLAIVTAGSIAGARSAFVASALATAAACFYFLDPSHSFTVSDPQDLLRVGALLVEGLAIGTIVAKMDAARANAESSAGLVTRMQALIAALAAARTPEDVAVIMVRQGVDVLQAASGIFVQPTSDGQLEVVAQHSLVEVARTESRQDVPYPTVVAYRTGKPEWVEASAEYDNAAAVGLPLSVDGRVLAVMAFRFRERRRFSRAERAQMQTLTNQAAQAFERSRLFAQEVATRRRLEAIDDLTLGLSTAVTVEAVAAIVVEQGMKTAGADTCTVYVPDPGDGSLRLIGDRGVNAEIVEKIRRIGPESNNPVSRTISTGEKIWAETEEDYLALYPALATMKVKGPRARAFWSVPLVSEGKPIGLLGMGFYAPRRFLPEERAFVETFTRHCGEALRRAELLETERVARTTAEKLKGSLETTLRSIGDAVIATDAKGKVTLLNPVAEQLTGWPEADGAGRNLREVFRIINEQTRKEVESPVDKVLREGVVVGLANHTVLVHRDGRHETPIDDSGAPIRNEGGRIDGVVLVFRDVSGKKHQDIRRAFLAEATTALSESLDYQSTLARVARLAVPNLADWCAVDIVEEGQRVPRQLAVTHVDPAKIEYARELGAKYPPKIDAPTGVSNVLKTGRSEHYPEITDEMLQAGAVDEEHLRICRELGLRSAMVVPLVAQRRVLGAMTFVYAESGRVYTDDDLAFAEDLARRCAIAIDNSRLYAAEQRARQGADVANRAKDEFLAMVSHELRTPLNAIMGWAKMLASAGLDEVKGPRAIATIERNAIAMAQLIEDLLDISRIISGKMRLEVHAVDLARVIEAAIESVKPAAEAKDIRLVPVLDSHSDAISGDSARLQQIVWNLLSNAVKFTPKGGRVEIVLRRVDSAVEISVSDTGKGIDLQFLPFVFDPFRQQEMSHKQSRGGLGLGLAISRQLVELHGGRIEAQSEGEGHGATFLVRIPLTAVAKTMRTPGETTARHMVIESGFERPSQLQGLNVLVVDDDDDARQLVKAVLEECGSQVVTVDNVPDAMAALTRKIPDLLISDIGMPGQDGYDLIRQVRALPAERGGGVPAAALTAYAFAEDRRKALNAGYSMHIPKPVQPSELVAVVTSLTRFSQRQA